jgi:hypothetical protein
MAWPSGTKASTVNLDQGTDLISQARPHIKQNVDNVNDIIDYYSDSDGPYSSVGEYTKQQYIDLTTLTDGANISWDLNNQVVQVTLAGNRTLDNPTNKQAGATYVLIVKQDGSGSRTLAYGTEYKFAGGITPTLSTGINDIDIITFVSDGTNLYGSIAKDFG